MVTGDGLEDVEEFKVVVVGDAACGKTQVVNRLVGEAYEPVYERSSWCAVRRIVVETSRGPVKLQLWDVAGEEDNCGYALCFLYNANGMMVVGDLTEPTSFEAVDYWRRQARFCCGGDLPTVVVGNKMDDRKSYGLDVDIKVSAKDDENLDIALVLLVRALLKDPDLDVLSPPRPLLEEESS